MSGWGGPREARKAIVESRERYLQNKAKLAAASAAVIASE
jgi:hypothetical protein